MFIFYSKLKFHFMYYFILEYFNETNKARLIIIVKLIFNIGSFLNYCLNK